MTDNRIIMTKGLPASGKTTWAKEMVHKWKNFKRVNKDDLREMLDCSVWSPENEKFILKIRDLIIKEALGSGFSIIVDDTNLHSKHKNALWKIASEFNTIVYVKEFNEPLEECIKRDSLREKPVGEQVIRKMYEQQHNTDK